MTNPGRRSVMSEFVLDTFIANSDEMDFFPKEDAPRPRSGVSVRLGQAVKPLRCLIEFSVLLRP